ncbi:MAG: MBL fold metallo-hydrolase [Halieaceae bacterium]|jgi:sulfur dioxygenase|nr:MBL fold metallo-hydrolase [Halieaceae bacterium]
MIFRQLFDEESYSYTYLIGDEGTRQALIIDPVLAKYDVYVQLIQELSLNLVYAIDTHVHNDHITALGKLRLRFRCETVHGDESRASGVSLHVGDGDALGLGDLCLRCLHTPGHTEESYCFLMEDQNLVFTGDTLMIRTTGRTDFQGGSAEKQYASLFDKLLCLPDDTLVYPGHDFRGMTKSTIGEERQFNPRLLVASVEDYVTVMEQVQLAPPKGMNVAVPANLRVGI